MTETNSTAPVRTDKPNKPYPDFPLFPHATKRWAKKIRGRFVYFGPWDDPDGALKRYLEQKDDLHAGRRPREQVSEGVTVLDLCNAFLAHNEDRVDSGEMKQRTWDEYKRICLAVIRHFGKNRLAADLRPDDFAELRASLAKKWGPVTLGGAIQRIRTVFKFGFDNEKLATPVRFGSAFRRPDKKTLRVERAKKGPRLFEAEEILRLLDAAGPAMKAMILLGANCAFGNGDCGTLPLSAVNLDTGWIDFPRPKTGIGRRCKLWPETVSALRAGLAVRPEPKSKDDAGLVFITKRGKSWHKATEDNPVSKEMRKLLDELGINGHRNFYCLRHTHRTIADETKDQPAVDFTMGHSPNDMASVYRERIGDDRLEAVAAHVHGWLFPPKK